MRLNFTEWHKSFRRRGGFSANPFNFKAQRQAAVLAPLVKAALGE